MVVLSWSDFKSRIDTGNLRIIEVTSQAWGYELIAYDQNLILKCTIDEDDNSGADKTDYETNYQPEANLPIEVRDSDGSKIYRSKTTQTGWHYEPRALDFYTAQLGSLYNREADGNDIDDGTDYGDATMAFYNASGVELVQGGAETDAAFQTRLDSGCVKTVIDWQSDYDFDIIGGKLQVANRPTGRAYIWCTIAPDIPKNLGGSVPYFAGGFNLKFFYDGEYHDYNGRGTKSFEYDPVYNSNKIRFTVKHAVGEQIGIQIIVDQFRA